MLPKLPLIALGVLLISSPPAFAATPSAPIPAEGQVSVTFASGVKSVKVKSAPAGVTVAGGVKGGKLAIAVIRPRGVAAPGKVALTIKGKAKGVKTIPAALNGGTAPNCKDLAGLLSKRLQGSADVKGLAGVLAAKLCGKAAPANAASILSTLGLGAAPALPAPAAPAAGASPTPSFPTAGAPRPTPTATPVPGGKPCANGADDDGDGQTDLEDPGCADGNDASETGEVAVSAECLNNGSGIGMGDDPTGLFGALNSCGSFTKVRVDIAPGTASCQILTGGTPWTCAPSGTYAVATGAAINTADLLLTASGAVKCDRKATIALYRPNGEVAEIYGPIGNCKTGGAAKPACSNGKDDDGDGMIDDHFADGATDPDPGCTSTTDTSENSELLPAGSCQMNLDLFDDDASVAIAAVQGCGQIQGFWFHAAGTVVECVYKLGQGAVQTCEPVRESGGTMFTKTTESLSVAVGLNAEGDCRPMTLAVINADNTVVATRKKATGC